MTQNNFHRYSTYQFSRLERSTGRYKILAWTSALLLIGVLTVLTIELLGVTSP